MKKILIIFLCLILVGCGNIKKEDLYLLNINGNEITVGYDDSSLVNDYVDEYTTMISDDKEVLDKMVVYVKDVDGYISIDNNVLGSSISETCSLLNGELTNNNGNVCLISKRVNKHDNYILIYGDILSDNLDEIDRIEVYFK